MAGEKLMENSESVTQGLKSNSSVNPSEKDTVLSKDRIVPDSTSPVSPLVDASSGMKGDGDQISVAEHGVYYQPTSYNYYCPGYNGPFAQLDDQGYLNGGGGSYAGMQSYYFPGYSPYEHSFVSPGYIQPHVSYGSEALSSHSWDSTFAGDVTNKVVNNSENAKPKHGENGSVKSNGFNPSKTANAPFNKTANPPLNSKARQFTVSSNFPKPFFQTQPLKPLNKLSSGLQSAVNMNGFYHAGKFSAFGNENRGVFMHYGSMNYQPNGRVWNGNQKFKPRYNYRRGGGEIEASTELTCGPRADSKSDPSKLSAGDVQPEQIIQSDKYNLEEFESDYENAKFYVIKSYSEDDVHKSIKYDVWSSTQNGNKKLDAAFRDADAKAAETGNRCPVFLLFSVNGSGQFVGVAEMIGQVDFKKNMDFWQLDKWNGFFPVKWHIVKDLPNNLLRHIILENNDNRPVTYSRDTQEIGLKQGLEMLSIFKNYSAKTSLLDDFNFYENREKLLKAYRTCEPVSQTTGYKNDDIAKHLKGGMRTKEEELKTDGPNPMPLLVNLTKNLSLNPQPLKSNV